MTIKVLLVNFESYKRGELDYARIVLPIDREALEDVKQVIGVSENCEYLLANWDCPIKAVYESIDIFSDVDDLNELAKRLENIPTEDYLILDGIYEATRNLEKTLEIYERNDFSVYDNCRTMEEVAYDFLEKNHLESVPDYIKQFFNYKAFGEYMKKNAYFVQLDNGNMMEVYY